MSSIGFYFPAAGGSSATPDLQAVTVVGNTTDRGVVVTDQAVSAGNNSGGNIKNAFLDGINANQVYAGAVATKGGSTASIQLVADTTGATPVVSWEMIYGLLKAIFTVNGSTPVLFNSSFNFRQAVALSARDVAFVDELRQYPTRKVNVNFTVLVTDGSIEVDASAATITGTLPTSATLAGYVFAIKLTAKTGAFVCNLTAAALIDGAPTYTIPLLNGGAFIQYTGTTWIVLATKN